MKYRKEEKNLIKCAEGLRDGAKAQCILPALEFHHSSNFDEWWNSRAGRIHEITIPPIILIDLVHDGDNHTANNRSGLVHPLHITTFVTQ